MKVILASPEPDTVALRPNAAGTYQEWSTFGSGTAHWDRTSDQNDATGVMVTGSTTLGETLNLENPTQTGTINSVTAYARALKESTSYVLMKSPSSTTPTTGGWTNPTGAFADGTDNAYITSAKPSASQTYFEYGFDIPPEAVISHVRIRYDAWTVGDEKIRVDVSWDGGTTWSEKQVTNLTTTTETTYLYDVTDVTSWTPAELTDANLRVRVDAYTVRRASEVRLDWIPVEVTYYVVPKFRILWRTHGTDYESSDIAPGAAFTDYSETRTANPHTGLAWTWDEVNALEVGARASALTGSDNIKVSEILVVVRYTPQLLPPVAPSLVSPGNGTTIDSLMPTFDWSDVSGAESYTIEVATDSGFTYKVFTKDSVESTAISPVSLSYGTRYYWRVRGTNAAGAGDWSSVWSFTPKLMAPKVMSFAIESGATHTNDNNVQLTITAKYAIRMSFSSDGVVWSEWEPYRESKSYTLLPPDGPKNIYIRVENAGDISQTVSASIILDRTPPSTTHSLSGDLGAEGYKGSVVVTLTSTDTYGVESTKHRIDGGEWETGNTFVVSTEGKHTIEYYSTDLAGNAEEIKSLEVTVFIPALFPPVLIKYWWAFLGTIVAAGVSSVYITRKIRLSSRLKGITREKREIVKLIEEAETRYYKEGSITRDVFDELIRGHKKRLTELEKEERVLKD